MYQEGLAFMPIWPSRSPSFCGVLEDYHRMYNIFSKVDTILSIRECEDVSMLEH